MMRFIKLKINQPGSAFHEGVLCHPACGVWGENEGPWSIRKGEIREKRSGGKDSLSNHFI
jgi:predicted NUDIX family NTP pyrophosphohydrolase